MSEQQGNGTYRTPDRGEDHSDGSLPLGWIADRVDEPEDWTVQFVEDGTCLRFRRELDREHYGLSPPGYPGVGITSGSDYWVIIGDSDHVLRDVWHDPDDDPEDVVASVEEAIEAVQADIKRVRLTHLLSDRVPCPVVENLIERFGTAERVVEIEDDSPMLESVTGVGPARREIIQHELQMHKWSENISTEDAEVRVVGGDSDGE
jgi:hypothetical protein